MQDKLAASLAKRVAMGKMAQEAMDALLANILIEEKPACADTDLVIECVKEDIHRFFIAMRQIHMTFCIEFSVQQGGVP